MIMIRKRKCAAIILGILCAMMVGGGILNCSNTTQPEPLKEKAFELLWPQDSAMYVDTVPIVVRYNPDSTGVNHKYFFSTDNGVNYTQMTEIIDVSRSSCDREKSKLKVAIVRWVASKDNVKGQWVYIRAWAYSGPNYSDKVGPIFVEGSHHK